MIKFRNESPDSAHPFSIYSEDLQESDEPTFVLYGMVPDRDCLGIPWDLLFND